MFGINMENPWVKAAIGAEVVVMTTHFPVAVEEVKETIRYKENESLIITGAKKIGMLALYTVIPGWAPVKRAMRKQATTDGVVTEDVVDEKLNAMRDAMKKRNDEKYPSREEADKIYATQEEVVELAKTVTEVNANVMAEMKSTRATILEAIKDHKIVSEETLETEFNKRRAEETKLADEGHKKREYHKHQK